MNTENKYTLNKVEIETVKRAARLRNLNFDPQKSEYSEFELKSFGLFREGFSRTELKNLGFESQKINSFQDKSKEAQEKLKVETPFGSGIEKWELPIDMHPIKIYKTIFPPNTYVAPHIHPKNNDEDPGGSLRIVFSGRIFYEGKEFKSGDWFFVPNGETYEFLTDPIEETIVFYSYRFFGVEEGNRFSHPHSVKNYDANKMENIIK